MTPLHTRPGPLGAFFRDVRRRTEPPNRVIKLIIAYKMVAAFLLFIAGLFFLGLLVNHDWSTRLRVALVVLGLRTDNHLIRDALTRLGLITPAGATGLGLISFFYAGLEATEGIGLLNRRRWAEYLVLLATGAFLPYECLELLRHTSWTSALIFLVNLAIAAYLVKAKRLFHEREEASARADREVLAPLVDQAGVPAP